MIRFAFAFSFLLLTLVFPARGFVPPREEMPEPLRRELAANASSAAARGAASSRAWLAPGTAHVRALVLQVEFADTTWDERAHPSAWFDSLLFGERRSVRRYFREAFRDRFELEGDVVPVRRLDVPIDRYTGDGQCEGCALGIGEYPRNAQKLVEDLVPRVAGLVDGRNYDEDGDGAIDALIVVHAGVGFEDGFRSPRQFQSHEWHTVEAPLLDGVAVRSYVLLSEWSGVGAFAHELVHLYGVPDLYDLSRRGVGLGDWSLMGQGAALGSPRYSNPAHPDAWTRLRTGYAEAIESPFPGLAGEVTIDATQAGGPIVKLWGEKRAGTEYFLLEHRSRSLGIYDHALPGEGLLVYHVDESVPSQRDGSRYKVALEQADGEFDLERFSFPYGDEGDPFPGSRENTRFGDATTPSSRAHDGSPSGVTIESITRTTTGSLVSVRLADGPRVRIDVAGEEEVKGDGDPRPEAGERWALSLVLRNRGLDAEAGFLSLRSSAPGFAVEPDSIAVAALAEEAQRMLSHAFVITLPAGGTGGVSEVPLTFVHRAGVFATESNARVVTGSVFGFSTGFEEGESLLSHRAESRGHRDAWHRSSARTRDGAWAMACGAASGGAPYPDSLDAVLESPPILLGGASMLRFSHWIDAEADRSLDAFDGARIEISLDGSTWQVVTPQAGYSHDPVANATFALFDGPVFSGSFDWRDEEVDLGDFDGRPLWIRFRFASDALDETPHEGWVLDRVRVETNDAPVAHSLSMLSSTSEGITVRWSVAENTQPLEATFHLRSVSFGLGEPVTTVLRERALDASFVERVTDAPLAAGERRRYEILELEAGSAGIVRAALELSRDPLPEVPVVLSAGPSPLRSGIDVFRIRLAPSTALVGALRIYTAGGREIARVPAPGGDGSVIEWNGRLAERRAPPGVYFYRLEGVGARGAGRIVVTP